MHCLPRDPALSSLPADELDGLHAESQRGTERQVQASVEPFVGKLMREREGMRSGSCFCQSTSDDGSSCKGGKKGNTSGKSEMALCGGGMTSRSGNRATLPSSLSLFPFVSASRLQLVFLFSRRVSCVTASGRLIRFCWKKRLASTDSQEAGQ